MKSPVVTLNASYLTLSHPPIVLFNLCTQSDINFHHLPHMCMIVCDTLYLIGFSYHLQYARTYEIVFVLAVRMSMSSGMRLGRRRIETNIWRLRKKMKVVEVANKWGGEWEKKRIEKHIFVFGIYFVFLR